MALIHLPVSALNCDEVAFYPNWHPTQLGSSLEQAKILSDVAEKTFAEKMGPLGSLKFHPVGVAKVPY